MIVFNRPKLYKNTLQYCFSTRELRVTIKQNTKSWTKIKMKMLHIAMKFALISLKCTVTHSKIIDIVSNLSFIFYSRSRIEWFRQILVQWKHYKWFTKLMWCKVIYQSCACQLKNVTHFVWLVCLSMRYWGIKYVTKISMHK